MYFFSAILLQIYPQVSSMELFLGLERECVFNIKIKFKLHAIHASNLENITFLVLILTDTKPLQFETLNWSLLVVKYTYNMHLGNVFYT